MIKSIWCDDRDEVSNCFPSACVLYLYTARNRNKPASNISWMSANSCCLYCPSLKIIAITVPLTHNWIHTQCMSACGWRSCCASSLKSENPYSSFYWRVQKKVCLSLENRQSTSFCVNKEKKLLPFEQSPHTVWNQKESLHKFLYVDCRHKLWHQEAGSLDGTEQEKQIQEGRMQNNCNMQNSKTHQLHLTGARMGVRATISQACWVCVYHIKPNC